MKRKPTTAPPPAILPRLPDWVAGLDISTPENAGFAAGAALSALHMAMQVDALPQPLWRARLALAASEACAQFAGRSESPAQMRDEVHLLRPGEAPGPAGTILQAWLRATERPISPTSLQRALPHLNAAQLAGWTVAGATAPLAGAAQIVQAVLADLPRADTTALILADSALSHALGWRHMLPLLAQGMTRRDLARTDAELHLACTRAIVTSARHALTLAADLTRKADALRAVTPRLRAKGADQAVSLFLSQDALAPPRALVPMMSDRAARRFCERLVELGVLRELTGRDSFRLYGV